MTKEELGVRLAEIRQKIFIESRNTWRAQARRDYWKRALRLTQERYKLVVEGQREFDFDEHKARGLQEISESHALSGTGLPDNDSLPNGRA